MRDYCPNYRCPNYLATKMLLLGSLVAGAMLASVGCGGSSVPAANIEVASETTPTTSVSATSTLPGAETEYTAAFPAAVDQGPPVDPIVVLHTSKGDIQIQLYAGKVPGTVDNFLRDYAKRGFYDGTVVHHIESGMMVMMGGYQADMASKPVRSPIYNEASTELKNKRGTVAMARDPGSEHSATSQFFINLADNEGLDHQSTDSADSYGYCVFGEVISGMEIVDQIAALPTQAVGEFPAVPSDTVTIESVEQIR